MTSKDVESSIQRFLGDPARQEALSWVRAEGEAEQRTLGVLPDADSSASFVEEVYRAGAERVWAVDIRASVRSYADGDVSCQNSGKLLVELPTEPQRRQSVFRWEAKQARSLGFEGRRDTGQTHLLILLD